MVFLLPFSGIDAFAQLLNTEAYLGDLKDIENSKYRASAVSVVRNANGELISLVKIDAYRYLDKPILDEFLNSKPEYLVKQGNLDGQDVNLYHVKIEYHNQKCSDKTLPEVPGFSDKCNWYHRGFSTLLGVTDTDGIEHIIFRGLNHVETIKSEYNIEVFWNIITRE
ncbi:MAG: hypothetical protein H8E89_02820 [Candidatus Nitrosopelagicus sp.]|nr:hypothetical protein [Candidatus Nitrosopelagicus sp.]